MRLRKALDCWMVKSIQIFILCMFKFSENVQAVRCINCKNNEKELVCEEECEGDFCVLWKYREMSTDYKIQGCVTGIDRSKLSMGCRTNRVQATLCLCDSNDFCNEDRVQFSTVNTIDQVPLPGLTKCHSFTEASFMAQKQSTTYSGRKETLKSASCGQMPQYNFDLLIGSLWPGTGLFADACYELQTQGKGNSMLGCVCSTDGCNSQAPFHVPSSKLVTCHLVNSYDPSTSNDFCKGQLCLIQKSMVPNYGVQYLKGCISASASDQLKAGYRKVLGVEQWLCSVDFCNFDVSSVNNVKPRSESVQLFKQPIKERKSPKSAYATLNFDNRTGVGGRVKPRICPSTL
uniref:Sodefrin-like factor n=1 Tax=Ditylenchus dipsaci TaxID=166011 RepID=A0A915DU62_9BILA